MRSPHIYFERFVIEDVSFIRPKATRTRFNRSALRNVRFIGRARMLFFVEATLAEVDFRAPYADRIELPRLSADAGAVSKAARILCRFDLGFSSGRQRVARGNAHAASERLQSYVAMAKADDPDPGLSARISFARLANPTCAMRSLMLSIRWPSTRSEALQQT